MIHPITSLRLGFNQVASRVLAHPAFQVARSTVTAQISAFNGAPTTLSSTKIALPEEMKNRVSVLYAKDSAVALHLISKRDALEQTAEEFPVSIQVLLDYLIPQWQKDATRPFQFEHPVEKNILLAMIDFENTQRKDKGKNILRDGVSHFRTYKKGMRREKILKKDLEQANNKLRAHGGEIRFIYEGASFFSVENGKPRIFINSTVDKSVLEHEMDHFDIWAQIKQVFISKGLDSKQASESAFLFIVSGQGRIIIESRAQIAEFRTKIKKYFETATKDQIWPVTNAEISAKILAGQKPEPFSFSKIITDWVERRRLKTTSPIANTTSKLWLQSPKSLMLNATYPYLCRLVSHLSSRSLLVKYIREGVYSQKDLAEYDEVINNAIDELLLFADALRPFLIYAEVKIAKQAESRGDLQKANYHYRQAITLDGVTLIDSILNHSFYKDAKDIQSLLKIRWSALVTNGKITVFE